MNTESPIASRKQKALQDTHHANKINHKGAQQANMATLIQTPLMARLGEHLNVVDLIFCAVQDVFNQLPDLDLADSENRRDLYNTASIIVHELITRLEIRIPRHVFVDYPDGDLARIEDMVGMTYPY